jgi:methionyl-tRNA formyltransferase
MKIVFFGTPQYAVPSLTRLLQHPDVEVLGVVTQPDKRRGRGGQLTPSPVKQLALEHQLPLWQPRRIKADAAVIEALQATQADAFVVVAYGQILSQVILDIPRLGCINAHGSLLPTYRGAAPIQWCLYNGDRMTGVTTMLMDAGMDTGAMLLIKQIEIPPLMNAQELAIQLADLSAQLLIDTLLKLDTQQLQPIPQDDALATYARLIQKVDFNLDWARSATDLHNQIRGFFPNCIATFQDQPLKILRTIPISVDVLEQLPTELSSLNQWMDAFSSTRAAPGTVVGLAKGFGPILQTGVGAILLLEVQPQGKRPQKGWDFVNGQRLAVGDRINNGSVSLESI